MFFEQLLPINDMQLLTIFLIVPILSASGAYLIMTTREELMRFTATQQRCDNAFSIDRTSMAKSETGETVNDPIADCYVACLLEGMNLMSHGKLNIDLDGRSDVPPEYEDAMRSCANEQGSNKCETARRLIDCMDEHGVDIS